MISNQLSEFEKLQTIACKDCELSLRGIAKKLNHYLSIDVFLKKFQDVIDDNGYPNKC